MYCITLVKKHFATLLLLGYGLNCLGRTFSQIHLNHDRTFDFFPVSQLNDQVKEYSIDSQV